MSEFNLFATRSSRRVFLVGVLAPVAFWLLDSGIDSYLFEGGRFVDALWPDAPVELYMRSLACFLMIAFGAFAANMVVRIERLAAVQMATQSALDDALMQVIRGYLPICAWCKKIRSDDDAWQPLEAYVADRSGAQISHGICPQCEEERMPA